MPVGGEFVLESRVCVCRPVSFEKVVDAGRVSGCHAAFEREECVGPHRQKPAVPPLSRFNAVEEIRPFFPRNLEAYVSATVDALENESRGYAVDRMGRGTHEGAAPPLRHRRGRA